MSFADAFRPFPKPQKPGAGVGRDGKQGWSRASEESWERIFGPKVASRAADLAAASPNVVRLYHDPGEIISDGSGRTWVVMANYSLEEVKGVVQHPS